MSELPKPLSRKDFTSDQTVRWCPGCGDYAILSAIQNSMPKLGIKKEDIVFISGIGCSSRFPYYMDTYGFHTIHGRAPAIATGTKLSNPDLHVWMVTGDGDALAIGGNHFIHLLRRNVDINVLLFNNEIYGLTKGQSSPTSQPGLVTKSTPLGVIDRPFSPGQLAMGAGATFFARTIDTNPKLMTQIFVDSSKHRGTSLIEILQNCVIFNDEVFAEVTNKSTQADHQIHLEHGQPMLFGAEKQKGLVLNGFKLEVVTIGENGITADDILVHDAHEPDPTLHTLLLKMNLPTHPVALGIIRDVEAPTYGDLVAAQKADSLKKSRTRSMQELIESGHTWEV